MPENDYFFRSISDLALGFSQFDTRQTASDTNESHELIQFLRLL